MRLAVWAMAILPSLGMAQSWDVLSDFSASLNPNGNWSYRYGFSQTGPFTLMQETSTFSYYGSPFIAWHAPGNFPLTGRYVGHVLMHPSTGGYAAIRFVAPTTGSYSLAGRFYNLDDTSVDVHILKDGKSILNDLLVAPGSAHGGAQNETVVVDFSYAMGLAAGSQIDFLVGDGGNEYWNDSTGLRATFVLVPEPSTVGVLTASSMLALRRRRPRRLA